MDGNPISANKAQELASPNPGYGAGAGGGGDTVIDIAGLKSNVSLLNKCLLALATAFGAAFLFFILRIDDRFDRVDAPLREVQMSGAAQAETLRTIDAKLSKIEERLNAPRPDPPPSQR